MKSTKSKILDKIYRLRIERDWSEYKLSVQSGIEQSTISSWYNTERVPSIISLIRICDVFDISLSQLFMKEDETFVVANNLQTELLEITNNFNEEKLQLLIDFLSYYEN